MVDRIGELAAIAEECLEEPDPWLGLTATSSARSRCRPPTAASRRSSSPPAAGASAATRRGRKLAPVVTQLVRRAVEAGACAPTWAPPTSRSSTSCSTRWSTSGATSSPSSTGATWRSCSTACARATTRAAARRRAPRQGLPGGPGPLETLRPDLLDRPGVAVGILEEDVAEAGPALRAERDDVAELDAARAEQLVGGVHVVHHELQALDRAGLHRRQPGAEDDRAGRAGRGELDDARCRGSARCRGRR